MPPSGRNHVLSSSSFKLVSLGLVATAQGTFIESRQWVREVHPSPSEPTVASRVAATLASRMPARTSRSNTTAPDASVRDLPFRLTEPRSADRP